VKVDSYFGRLDEAALECFVVRCEHRAFLAQLFDGLRILSGLVFEQPGLLLCSRGGYVTTE
jgi:hypothetical protein